MDSQPILNKMTQYFARIRVENIKEVTSCVQKMLINKSNLQKVFDQNRNIHHPIDRQFVHRIFWSRPIHQCLKYGEE